jgi:nucleoside 2-deoxyribosyltransferase
VKCYLASPLGFAESTRAFMAELLAALRGLGLDVHNPWEGGFGPRFARAHAAPPEERAAALHAVNHAVGKANEDAIRGADMVVAVLDGVDVDSGTASEIGFAHALGKRVYGLRTDSRLTGDNVGATVNLQVEYFIEASGGSIVRSTDDLLARLLAAGIGGERGASA